MERTALILQWKKDAESGSLLTPKHDPNSHTFDWVPYRSVLTQHMSGSLKEFIYSGDYSIKLYSDSLYPNGAGYFEVIPNPSSGSSLVGFQLPSGSITPTANYDRLIFVSGSLQGWHVYAESSQQISSSLASGRLTLLEIL